ncbi:MAG: efflux RND transporter periplasmic adaptor subunit [Caldimonas sp.]
MQTNRSIRSSQVPRYLPLATGLLLGAALWVAVLAVNGARAADDKVAPAAATRPALTVTVTQPKSATLTTTIAANGNIAPWQEASIGTEANGLRLADVKVNVGDAVRRGQVLATFARDTIEVELAQANAAVVEAEATLAEASANAERALSLKATGALSDAAIAQYTTAERTARARLDAQRAASKARVLRVAQTTVRAPDDGVISARGATVGAVLPAGQELFRMIRKGRLEWRAEVAAADLAVVRPGMPVSITTAGGTTVRGTTRMVAPTVDPQTRNGLVYVDLPKPGPARAGMFAHGEFDVGSGSALTLPQSAVLLRDGFSYVLVVGTESKVRQVKVEVGRRAGDRIEITGGLDPFARVVASGGGFLTEGDMVRVVEAAPAPAASTAASAPTSTSNPVSGRGSPGSAGAPGSATAAASAAAAR